MKLVTIMTRLFFINDLENHSYSKQAKVNT